MNQIRWLTSEVPSSNPARWLEINVEKQLLAGKNVFLFKKIIGHDEPRIKSSKFMTPQDENNFLGNILPRRDYHAEKVKLAALS